MLTSCQISTPFLLVLVGEEFTYSFLQKIDVPLVTMEIQPNWEENVDPVRVGGTLTQGTPLAVTGRQGSVCGVWTTRRDATVSGVRTGTMALLSTATVQVRPKNKGCKKRSNFSRDDQYGRFYVKERMWL